MKNTFQLNRSGLGHTDFKSLTVSLYKTTFVAREDERPPEHRWRRHHKPLALTLRAMNGMSTTLIFSRRGTIRHHAFSVTFDASFPSTGESIHKMGGANVANDSSSATRELSAWTTQRFWMNEMRPR